MVSQQEILDLLVEHRVAGDEKFYSAKDLKKVMAERHINGGATDLNVSYKLSQLAKYGFLERRFPNANRWRDRRFWFCTYRAVKKEDGHGQL